MNPVFYIYTKYFIVPMKRTGDMPYSSISPVFLFNTIKTYFITFFTVPPCLII